MELGTCNTNEVYADTKYQALYLINNRLDSAWGHIYSNNRHRIIYMIAEQRNNFDEVIIHVNDIDDEFKEKYNVKLYKWNELHSEYVQLINKWYHVCTDTRVSHFNNYVNTIAYADMVQSFLENNTNIEVGALGEITINTSLKDRLTNRTFDIGINNDGKDYKLNFWVRRGTDSFYTKQFCVKLDDIPELISKAAAYDKLKDALVPFTTCSYS